MQEEHSADSLLEVTQAHKNFFRFFFVLFRCVLFLFCFYGPIKKQPKHSNVQLFTVRLTDTKTAASSSDFFLGAGWS